MRIRNAQGIVSLILFCAIIFPSCRLSGAAGPERGAQNTKGISSSSMRGRGSEVKEDDNPSLLFGSRVSSRSVKKEKRNPIPPYPLSGPWAKESSMIQAYGMPRRVLESNGEIERLNLDRISSLDGKVDEVRFGVDEPAGVRAYGMPKKNLKDNGSIERDISRPESHVRISRATDSRKERNDLEDLEAQEAKVFRPLFVYRKQIADRYRLKPRKNPIYGAYQYGRNRPRNFGHGYN